MSRKFDDVLNVKLCDEIKVTDKGGIINHICN